MVIDRVGSPDLQQLEWLNGGLTTDFNEVAPEVQKVVKSVR